MNQMFAKKASLIAIGIAALLFVGASFSGASHDLYPAMATIIAGGLIALAIAETNPRES